MVVHVCRYEDWVLGTANSELHSLEFSSLSSVRGTAWVVRSVVCSRIGWVVLVDADFF